MPDGITHSPEKQRELFIFFLWKRYSYTYMQCTRDHIHGLPTYSKSWLWRQHRIPRPPSRALLSTTCTDLTEPLHTQHHTNDRDVREPKRSIQITWLDLNGMTWILFIWWVFPLRTVPLRIHWRQIDDTSTANTVYQQFFFNWHAMGIFFSQGLNLNPLLILFLSMYKSLAHSLTLMV
jgi:hypothetical protein